NAGLIVRTGRAGAGADNFDGYEVSIDVARKRLVIGRHQHDFHLLKEAACEVLPDRWISLGVRMGERTLEVSVDGKSIASVEDEHPLPAGGIGLRHWQRPARYRKLWVKKAGERVDLPFASAPGATLAISGMWGPVETGDAVLEAAIENEGPFIGTQSQRFTFARGSG